MDGAQRTVDATWEWEWKQTSNYLYVFRVNERWKILIELVGQVINKISEYSRGKKRIVTWNIDDHGNKKKRSINDIENKKFDDKNPVMVHEKCIC